MIALAKAHGCQHLTHLSLVTVAPHHLMILSPPRILNKKNQDSQGCLGYICQVFTFNCSNTQHQVSMHNLLNDSFELDLITS